MADTKPVAAVPILATEPYVKSGLEYGLGISAGQMKLEDGKVYLIDDETDVLLPVALKNKQLVVLEV